MHFFDENIAKEYGVYPAIILQHFSFWIKKNRAEGRHLHDGKCWTYATANGLKDLFPYLTPKQLRNAIDKLVESGLVVTGNYNKTPMDRTKWYAITDLGESLLTVRESATSTIGEKRQMHLPYKANGTAPEGRCINNINNNIYSNSIDNITDNKTDKENKDKDILCISVRNARNPSAAELDEFFKSLWKLYPKKKGLGSVSKTQKLKLFRRGYDEISRCIERYKAFLEDAYSDAERDKFTKNGSTFFNSGYMDYLDENYDSQDTPVGDENSTDGLEPWERPDWQGGWVWVTSEDGLTERVFKPKPFNGEL